MTTIIEEKRALRKLMRAFLKSLSDAKRNAAGNAAARHIEPWLVQSKKNAVHTVAFFKGLHDEINTEALDNLLTAHGIHRHIPVINHENVLAFIRLKNNQSINAITVAHGPLSSSSLNDTYDDFDVIFVPGLAFDALGNRLGRGTGYYDRALANLTGRKKRPVLVGLALDEQIVKKIPCEKHDIAMDYICTPSLGILPTPR